MAISVFPTPVTSSINANSVTATSANTLYEGRVTLEPAIYQITCASGTVANVQFFSSATSLVTTATTSSGTVTLNLGSTSDRIRVWTNTGTNIVVTITKLANALTNQFNGTLDTITTVGASTYTGTSTSGFGYVVLVGGGGGGGGGNASTGGQGSPGGAGGVAHAIVQLTGSMPVTIGAAGTAGPQWASVQGANFGGNGGTSTFAGLTANGGAGGAAGNGSTSAGGTATGGLINTTGGDGVAGSNGGTSSSSYPFVVSSIGVGGVTVYSNTNPGLTGTGYGAGGGGGGGVGGSGPAGGAGRPGVLYVLRF